MKPFVGHTVMVGREWADRVGITTHHSQIDVLAFAANRADLAALCAEVAGGGLAKQLTHPGPRAWVGLGNGWEAFLDVVPEPGRATGLLTLPGGRVPAAYPTLRKRPR